MGLGWTQLVMTVVVMETESCAAALRVISKVGNYCNGCRKEEWLERMRVVKDCLCLQWPEPGSGERGAGSWELAKTLAARGVHVCSTLVVLRNGNTKSIARPG